jgi:hypothetical protein
VNSCRSQDGEDERTTLSAPGTSVIVQCPLSFSYCRLIYYKEEGLNCCAGRYSIVLNSK